MLQAGISRRNKLENRRGRGGRAQLYLHAGRSLPSLLLVLMTLPVAEGRGQVSAMTPAMREEFARGIEAQKKGDLDGAERIFKELIVQGGRFSQVYNALGNVYQVRGDHKQAISAFGESGRVDPKDPDHHALAGVSLLAMGKSREAVNEFRQAVRLQPKNLQFREQLAKGYLRLKDYPGAIDQYTKLVSLKGDDPEYRYQLGRAHRSYSDSCFQKIKEIAPGSARLLQETGDQYLAQGKLDKTIESYEKARTADPSIPEIHFLLGQFYLKQGEREKALRAVDEALTLTPANAAALALKQRIIAAGEKPPRQ